jgi:WD40 repeat protein
MISMLKELIQSHISVKELTFKPGGNTVTFSVRVINTSDRFASFRLDLTPAGADGIEPHLWYKISPDISSKTPPGTTIDFQVTIFDTPVPGFVGQMNLTVRVFSMELRDEIRQVVRLILEKGTRAVPLKIYLPIDRFQALPKDEIIIPVRIANPGQTPAETIVRLQGLDGAWFGGQVVHRLLIQPGKEAELRFICLIPFGLDAPSLVYPFTIEAQADDELCSQVQGSLEVLPIGSTDFRSDRSLRRMPARRRLWFQRQPSVSYPLQLEVTCATLPDQAIEIIPAVIDLPPDAIEHTAITVTQKRPLIGRSRKITLSVRSSWSDRRVNIQHECLDLGLWIHPILPLGVTILLAVGVLPTVGWWFSCLNPMNRLCGHQAAVTTVQFNGSGERAVSGSNDQTIRQWNTAGFSNPLISQEMGILTRLDKAVRVIRHKPASNDQVAVGLENGEIQLWDLLDRRAKPQATFGKQTDDRVLDLRFTPDSRSLVSAHGSGRVMRWGLEPNQSGLQEKPSNTLQLEFAIYSTAIVGNEGQTLAIAGKFNRLELWHWSKNQHRSIPYRKPGGQYDYIQSLATAEYQPHMMASGDNQGTITLWDMNPCLADASAPCKVVDQWSDGHGNNPVKSVALSRNGCYLASGGSDGRVMLWPLTAEGKRADHYFAGIQADQSFSPREAIQSVDIKVSQGNILLLSGSEDAQIRLKKLSKPSQVSCDRE